MEEVVARSLGGISVTIDGMNERGEIVYDDDVTLIFEKGKEREETSTGGEESLRIGLFIRDICESLQGTQICVYREIQKQRCSG